MRRREFMTLFGGAATAWPLAARAQQAPSVDRRIGVLMTGFSNVEAARPFLDPFHRGLRELGWIEGQNLIIEYRFAAGKLDLLPRAQRSLCRDFDVPVTKLAGQQVGVLQSNRTPRLDKMPVRGQTTVVCLHGLRAGSILRSASCKTVPWRH